MRDKMPNKKTIWVDIKNSHEPLLFKSLMKSLPYKFYITARDYAEIISLLQKYNIKFKKVGKYHGKNKFTKLLYLGIRSLELAMLVPNFDFFLSHGSVYGVIASKIRNRRSITITDNDFYNMTNKIIYQYSDFMILPKSVEYKKFKTKKTFQFNGFKEDIYIADFEPKKCKKEILYNDYIIIRPEAYKAYYLNGVESSIVPQLIDLFSKKINIALLPRYPEEKEMYEKKYKNNKRVFIPKKPINGLCGAWNAKAVLTGSGTLGREAACLGTPAVSFFPGKDLLSVDKELIKIGWLYHSRNPKEIVKYVLKSKKRRRSIDRAKKVKKEVVKVIKEVVG